jgi:Heparinase II/III-like protein
MMKWKTWARLGFFNVGQVALYRLLLRTGLHPAQRLKGDAPLGQFFRQSPQSTQSSDLPWINQSLYFGALTPPDQTRPPNWHGNPFIKGTAARADLPWWKIPDFEREQGDIKYIWEASRFEWAVNFALVGDLKNLNHWIGDWWKNNPPYLGPNWKCAQETSLRVLRLVLSASLLGQFGTAESALVETIKLHLARIRPTLAYARAQQNNHATSEAAALLVGGLFLHANGRSQGISLMQTGLRNLERAIDELIMADGSFSQNSTNYHRFMLDTLCLAELITQRHGGPKLAPATHTIIRSSIQWLIAMTDQHNGQPFNLGHNDSAYLLPYPAGRARDFRTTITVAKILFDGTCEQPLADAAAPVLKALDLTAKLSTQVEASSTLLNDGGLAILRNRTSRALLRLPGFKFRPGHCDVLHADLWVDGENVLRDTGTITYSSGDNTMVDLATTAHHNAIQFDDTEQMPRLSRFLWGDWLQRAESAQFQPAEGGGTAFCAYGDRNANKHQRRISLTTNCFTVTDEIFGPFERAVLRWHLLLGKWRAKDKNTFTCGRYTLRISSTANMEHKLTTSLEALNYGTAKELPLLETRVTCETSITTELTWSDKT